MNSVLQPKIGTFSYLKLKIIPGKIQAFSHCNSDDAVCCFNTNKKNSVNYEFCDT